MHVPACLLCSLLIKGVVTNNGKGGGLQNGRGGGQVKFYPCEKGGGGKCFSHAEGGGAHNVLGLVLCGSLKF